MAIGWLTVLTSVPWSDVISNAPKVAEGARKLWSAVSRKPARTEAPAQSAQAAVSRELDPIAALQIRVTSLEAAVSDLHGQMLASSELIKALADQNARLIERIEAIRVRALWLTVGTVAVAVTALVGLVLAIARHGA